MTPDDVDYGVLRVNRILCCCGAREECKNARIDVWIKYDLLAFHVCSIEGSLRDRSASIHGHATRHY